jgi:uridylate kinase
MVLLGEEDSNIMKNHFDQAFVLKLGGSLIVPNGGLNIEYITEFYKFINKQIAEHNKRFFIFIGGGMLARHYRDAGAAITGHELTDDDLDWLGVHATRMNAHLFRTIFRENAFPYIIDDYNMIQKTDKPIVIAAGWKPGWSSDYPPVILAQDYQVTSIIKMSNTDYIYDKDPKKFPDAKPNKTISWADYRASIGDKWVPGSNQPFDPVASKAAHESGITVKYIHGNNLANLENLLDGKEFVGTTIA